MYKEGNLVAIVKDLPEKELVRGHVGTIAFMYNDGGLYEVEFINAIGETVAVATLSESEILAVQPQNAILHVANVSTNTV